MPLRRAIPIPKMRPRMSIIAACTPTRVLESSPGMKNDAAHIAATMAARAACMRVSFPIAFFR